MSVNKYIISIHISRNNNFTGVFNNVAFPGFVAGNGDCITFTKQKITIVGKRSKKSKLDDIINNKKNSLYQQIFKSLVYLYAANKRLITIRSIDIERFTSKTQDSKFTFTLKKHEQPIKNEFNLRYDLSDFIKDKIWEESSEANSIRTILTLWFSALSSNDRFYIFERNWRTFERLCFYKSRAIAGVKEFDAIKNMKDYICHNTHLFPDSLRIADKLSGRKLISFDWEGYITNEFPTLSRSSKPRPYTEIYKNHLVICNTDIRIMNMLTKTLSIRKAELRRHGVYNDITNHISTQISLRLKANEQVLCILCCKYAYYLRNKMFHGEKSDFSFTFSDKTKDNLQIDILNYLFGNLINDLLLQMNLL